MDQKKIIVVVLIVVLIITVIFILHALHVKKTEGNGGRVFVHGTYVVTTGPKTSGSSSDSAGSSTCFYLNGLEAPKLVLKRGVYYEFRNESSEPLYFSTSRHGGPGAPGSLAKNKKADFQGLSEGTIFFKITEDLPQSFYYQSGKHEDMGGQVEIG